MSLASLILALVTLQRLGELVLSHFNTRRLLQKGAVEVGANHYPLVVSLHAAWLIALWIWGRHQDVNLVALAAFVALQGLRLWVLATLGPRWTTRIIVLPGAPLVTSGPYKYLGHPNYAVVAGEIKALAHQSQKATEQVRRLLGEIQERLVLGVLLDLRIAISEIDAEEHENEDAKDGDARTRPPRPTPLSDELAS